MTRRVVRNLGANGGAVGVMIVGQLALVPIFLSYWAHETYADWLVFMTLPSILFVLNGGLGTITGVQLSLHVTRGEEAEGTLLFRRMLGLILVVVGVFVAASCVPAVIDGLYWLLNPNAVERGEFGGIITALGIYLTLAMLQSVVRALYRANEVEYTGVALQSGGRLLEIAVTAGTVVLGGTLAQTINAVVVAAAVTTVVLAVQSQRLPRRISLVPGWPAWPVWRFFLVDGLPVVAVQAGTRCSQQGMLLLLNHLLDARAVLLVGTLQTVQRALMQAPMMLSWAHGPDMTTAYAQDDGRRVGGLLSTALASSLGSAVAAGTAVMLFGPWLYGLWVRGADLDPSRGYFVLLALGTVLLGVWWPLSVLLNAVKQHRLWSWFYVVVVMANVALLPVVTPWLGAATPFALSVLTGVVMTGFLIRTTGRLLQRSFGMSLLQALALFPWLPRGQGRPVEADAPRAARGGAVTASVSPPASSPPSHPAVVSRVPCSERS